MRVLIVLDKFLKNFIIIFELRGLENFRAGLKQLKNPEKILCKIFTFEGWKGWVVFSPILPVS